MKMFSWSLGQLDSKSSAAENDCEEDLRTVSWWTGPLGTGSSGTSILSSHPACVSS